MNPNDPHEHERSPTNRLVCVTCAAYMGEEPRIRILNPREANGPNGYPKDNPDFRRAADAVIERVRPMVERAQAFRERMREDFRKMRGE